MKNNIKTEEMEWIGRNTVNFFDKQLLKHENGALKLVKVAPTGSFPVHIHIDKTEYVYVLKGHPSFIIDTEEFTANPDEFYIFHPNINHAILNKSDDECILLVGSIKNKNP